MPTVSFAPRPVGRRSDCVGAGGAPRSSRFYTDWLWFGEVGYQPGLHHHAARRRRCCSRRRSSRRVVWLVGQRARGGRRRWATARPMFIDARRHPGVAAGRDAGADASRLRWRSSCRASSSASAPAAEWDSVAAPGGNAWLVRTRSIRSSGSTSGSTCSRCRSGRSVRGLGQVLVVLAASSSGGLYLLSGSLRRRPLRAIALSMTRRVRQHLSWLAAAFLAVAGGRRVAPARRISARAVAHHLRRQLRGRPCAACPPALLLAVACVRRRRAGARPGVRRPAQLADAGRPSRSTWRSSIGGEVYSSAAAALRGHAERADARDAVHSAQHRRARAAPSASTRRRGARTVGRRAADARRHRAQRGHARRTCGCGITSRCSRRSGRSRRSAPTTSSARWTTIATGCNGRCAR